MTDVTDIEALATSVAEVLASECGREIVLHHANDQHGPLSDLWQTISRLGWTALPIGEEHGGLGMGIEALASVYREMGRVAAPLPFLSTMLAAQAIELGGSAEQRSTYLPRIVSGQTGTLGAPHAAGGSAVPIAFEQEEAVLNGTAEHLIDARDAALCVILAKDQAGMPYRVILHAEDRVPQQTRMLWDRGHTMSNLRFEEFRVPRHRVFESSPEIEAALLTHAAIGLAAEAVGGADGILEITIEYLKTRQQFGRAIGSFQALKHRVADHKVRLVGAHALLRSAVNKAACGTVDAAGEASAAKALACATYETIARDCIQLHGGIGFTSEHVCHLYLKRARLIGQLFGDETNHIQAAAQSVLQGEAA